MADRPKIPSGYSPTARSHEIDILKAVGIICMVAGHSGAPFSHFIYLFHMAIFFIASGFFFKDRDSNDLHSLISAIKRKLRQLWLPFVLWHTFFVLM
ncbi:MAG: acyltransferase family protein, partial [Lachnospiraceae bacterium]|nr:acyltransferase family protein [Lachnospiraceae bacterium]